MIMLSFYWIGVGFLWVIVFGVLVGILIGWFF